MILVFHIDKCFDVFDADGRLWLLDILHSRIEGVVMSHYMNVSAVRSISGAR